MENVETCDRQGITKLGEALAALNGIAGPVESVADIRRDLDVATALDDNAERAILAFDTLAQLLELDPAASLRQVTTLCEQMVALDSQSPSVKALLASQLFDPLMELAIAEQSAAAHAMRVERSQLLESVDPAAIDTDPAELKSLADTLEDSGFFARLFGGEYKRAHRRATRLLRDTSERMASAEILRQTARLGDSAEEFRGHSATRSLFPEMLWKGMDSSFEDLDQARGLLVGVKGALANDGLDQSLAVWLRLDTDTRRRTGELARTLLPTAQRLASFDRDASSYRDALTVVRKTRACLTAANSVLDTVRVKPDGMIMRDGESLPARIEALDSCAAEFDRLRQADGFAFVGGIAQPLESLGRALEHSDQLGASDDIVDLLPALRQSDAPVALLDAVIDASGPYCAACRKWEQAAARLISASGLQPLQIVRADADDTAQSWQDMNFALGILAADDSGAREAAEFLKYRAELADRGMAKLCSEAVSGSVPATCLADTYELHLTSQLLHEFLSGDGSDLQRIGGAEPGRCTQAIRCDRRRTARS